MELRACAAEGKLLHNKWVVWVFWR